MLNLLIKEPHLSFLSSLLVTCVVLSNFFLFKVLNLKILNLLPSQPVLSWVNKSGKPSSKIIKIEENNKIGSDKIIKINEKALSIKIFKSKLGP